MTLFDFYITEEQFRKDKALREALARLMIEDGNQTLAPIRRAFLLFLQAEKNNAISPKLPPEADAQVRSNVGLLMQGVTTLIKDLNRFITPLTEEEPPNPTTHWFDSTANEWFPISELPENLQRPVEPIGYIPPLAPRKPRPKK